MKVRTKRPVNWFGPYHLMDLFKFILPEDTRDKFAEMIPITPFQKIHDLRCWFNRDKITIEPHDTWSMDYTLAPIILPMLKQLKETKHGIPCDFIHPLDPDMDMQECHEQFELFPETKEPFKGQSVKDWDATMDKMIWSFEQIILDQTAPSAFWEPYWEDMTDADVEAEKSSIWNQMKVDHPRKKINRMKYDEYEARMQEGFMLFGKHFRSLWD